MSYYVNVDRGTGTVAIQLGRSPTSHGEPQVLGPFSTIDVALNAVFDSGVAGDIVLPPGRHRFTSPVTVNRPTSIRVGPSTELVVDHSGSVGLFEFTANNCVLSGGGKLIATTPVVGQSVVKCTGTLGQTIDGVTIDLDFTDSDDLLQHFAGTVATDTDTIAVNNGSGYAAGSTSMRIDVNAGSSMWIIGDKFTIDGDSSGTVYTTTNSGQVSQSTAVGETDVIRVDNGAGYAAGANSMTVDVSSGTSTFTIGDRFTIAGETETFVCLNSGTFDTTGVTLEFYPSLSTTVADNAVITFVLPTLTFTPGLAEAVSDDDELTFVAEHVTPMIGVTMQDCVAPIVTNMRLYPAKGTTGWFFEEGSFLKFSNNHYGSKTGGSLNIGAVGVVPWTPREGYRALEIKGMDYFNVGEGCTFHGVGTVEHPSLDWDYTGLNSDGLDNVLDKMIYIYSSNNGGNGNSEEGHSRLSGFIVEGVHARNTVHITGWQFFFFTDAQIGAGSGSKVFNLATRFDCAVRLDIQGTKACPNFAMDGVGIHNQQWGRWTATNSTSPPQVYIAGCNQGTEISNCKFNLVQKGPAILVSHGTTTDLTIKNNVFSTVAVQSPPTDQATMPIRYIATGARLETGNYHWFSGNVANDFRYGFDSVTALPLGFAKVYPTGMDFDPVLSAGLSNVNITLTVKGGGDPTITDPDTSDLFANLAVGDLFHLSGPTAAGTVNKSNVGLMKVKAKTNDNTITVETNDFFSDFVSTETNVSGCTLQVFPRMSTNIHNATTAV